MGFRNAVTEEHVQGVKPVKVITKVRNVEYHTAKGISKGQEIVKEVLVHPDDVDCLGEPVVVGETKVVKDVVAKKEERWRKDKPVIDFGE